MNLPVPGATDLLHGREVEPRVLRSWAGGAVSSGRLGFGMSLRLTRVAAARVGAKGTGRAALGGGVRAHHLVDSVQGNVALLGRALLLGSAELLQHRALLEPRLRV